MFTLSEIIDLAIRIEKNGENAYRKAQEEVSNPSLASMLKWLAEEEVEHEKWFTQLKENTETGAVDPKLEEMGMAILQGVLGDQAFSIKDADFCKIEDVNSLLELSIEFEKDTILFYEMLSAFIDDKDILSQLDTIIKEEKRHVQILEEFLENKENAMTELFNITDAQVTALKTLRFGPPVTHVYNPLEYARWAYDTYLRKYGDKPKEVVLVGMNPGPWGMAQTGIPFGEITVVRDWLGIHVPIGRPVKLHPKRPVDGFHCKRSEVSGKRLWGWAKKTFVTPARFFTRFFVANYCPLMFIEESGRNRTPNTIRSSERKPLLSICDQALRDTVLYFNPRYVVGIGEFAAGRAKMALGDLDVIIGRITHPSPANPKANKGWEPLIRKEFSQLGIKI